MIRITQEEITKNWKSEKYLNPLVSINCLTYNHEFYIAEALDGFLSQKTDFPFEVIVHDDASTDKTAEIIREYEKKYPKIIKPIYESENQWSKKDGSLERIMNSACKGKYIAFCEGDDFWINEKALQMKVDYMEKKDGCGLVYSKAKTYYQETKVYGVPRGKKISKFNELIFKGNCIPTCTTLFRRDLYNKYLEEIQPSEKKWLMGDYPLNLWFVKNSKIKFMPKVTGVYRILKESASHSKNLDFLINFSSSTNNILNFYKNKYNLNIEMPDYVKYVKFCYYNARNDRQGILSNSDFSKMPYVSMRLKIKVMIFKNDFLYGVFKKIKK